MPDNYKNIKAFYPYYLADHQNAKSRLLHFIGTALVIVILIYAIFTLNWKLLLLLPLVGYGFAWIGHFWFEKNRPASFKYPLYSLMSDFMMFWDIMTFQIDDKLENAKQTVENNSKG